MLKRHRGKSGSPHVLSGAALLAMCVCIGGGLAYSGPASCQNAQGQPQIPPQSRPPRPALPKGLSPSSHKVELPKGVSNEWFSRASEQIRSFAYHAVWQDRTPFQDMPSAWAASNPAQGFRTYFAEAGLRVVPMRSQAPPWQWGLALARFGRSSKALASKPTPQAKENRVSYQRGGLSEWYLNSARGLEQGFVVESSPEGGGPLAIDLVVSGGLTPAFTEDRKAVDFSSPSGINVLRFGDLHATDAAGLELAAWFEPWIGQGQGGIRLVVVDAGATYPVTVDPLATTPAWTAQGTTDSEFLGISVQTAGDVNGDGYSDVIVGADGIDTAYVFFGSPSGLHASPDWTFHGQAGSAFGCSVATAGDVKGNGYSAIIIGAWTYVNSMTDEGGAFVFYGSPTGPSATPDWIVAGGQEEALLGASVSTAGDVNGDGYSDIIIGVPGYSSGDRSSNGRVLLFLGSSSGLSATPAWTYDGEQDGESLGTSAQTAGDVNGDGYADVIVGSPGYNGYVGRALAFYGSSSGLPTSPDWTYLGIMNTDDDTPYFGWEAAPAGDVNGDGYADVILGAPFQNTVSGTYYVGAAYVFKGSSTGLSSSSPPDWSVLGDQAGALLGYSVFTAGDVNGDGYADVIVGAPYYNDIANGLTNAGAAFVYFGSSAGLSTTANWSVLGTQDHTGWGNVGTSVATAGDVNGDGFSDVIVGAPFQDTDDESMAWVGAASVYLGSSSTLAATPGWSAGGSAGDSEFGFSIASAGDVNGDGYDDILVGDPNYSDSFSQEGAVFLYLGGPTGPIGPALIGVGDQAGAHFGYSVSSAGDVNGDGYSDVIVGAPGENSNTGKVYLYLGGPLGLPATASWTAVGQNPGDSFGHSVAAAGDVNGDGYGDILVGAPGGDRAYAYYGSSSGLPSSPSWTLYDTSGDNTFGQALSTAGDVNGDGFSDVIVGAPGYSGSTGKACLYLGGPLGLPATASWTAVGENLGDSFGYSVATAGDVNGDGYSDVIAGAPGYSSYTGKAYVCLGGSLGLSATASWTAVGENAGDSFGNSVATAGDVNGDGFSDVAVGAYGNQGKAYLWQGSASGLTGAPTWTATGTGLSFGYCLASGGDVNGDGYADLLVGIPNPGGGPGAVSLYYGDGEAGQGRPLGPRQIRSDDSAPIAQLGAQLGGSGGFRLGSLGWAPFGRGKVKLDWEVKPLGTPFNGSGLALSSAWSDTGASALGCSLDETTGVLPWGLFYHWRERLLYNAVTYPYQPIGRWYTQPRNGWEEADLQLQYSSSDWDGDGIANGDDCAPRDPTTWAVPSAVPHQGWQAGSKSILTWQAPALPGCVTPTYDVLRASSASNWNAATCIASGITSQTATDATLPTGGQRVLFYLIRVLDACGSTMGTNSKGVPRTGRTCP